MWFLAPPRSINELLVNPGRGIVYLIIFIFLCVMLGRVWVEVSGLAPRDIAGQIIDSGMQIPGFRSSEKIIERILKKYIPTLVILNGIIIAVLSFFADSLGALTSGTGLLIAMGITHQYAETISKEFAAAQYPGLRGLLGMD
jgi:preprotein translocase subunit SecY